VCERERGRKRESVCERERGRKRERAPEKWGRLRTMDSPPQVECV
jgi:hypothetical protein